VAYSWENESPTWFQYESSEVGVLVKKGEKAYERRPNTVKNRLDNTCGLLLIIN
jgi:hypothetical protein